MTTEAMQVRDATPVYVAQVHMPKAPAGYKQTEVGVIPVDWEVSRIDTHTTIKTGSRNTQDRVKGGAYPFFVRSQQIERIDTFSFDGESVLTAGDGVGTGKVFHYIDGKFDVHQRVYKISDFSDQLDGRYFFYHFSTRFYDRIMSMTAKSSVDSVRMEMIAGMEILLPPEPEQRAIATALSDVDALLEALDRLIAKKRDIIKATMQQLLTAQTRLPGFEGEWESVSLRQVVTQKATNGIVTAGTFVQDGVKMLRGGDISDGRISGDLPMVSRLKAAEYSRTTLIKDDVVIALVGYPGASAKIPTRLIGANISRAVGLLRLNGKICPNFLVHFLNSPYGRRMVLAPSAGSAQQVVNLSALNKLRFSIPHVSEQDAIASVLSGMDAELDALEQRRAKASRLKQAMMQELLTGRTRLVETIFEGAS